MDYFLLFELIYFFTDLFSWSNDLLIILLFDKPFFVSLIVFCFLKLKVTSKCSNQVKVSFRDCCIVLFYICILFFMLMLELCNRIIFLGLNLAAFYFALFIHFFPQKFHFVFVLHLDFIWDTLIFFANISLLCCVCFGQCVEILLMPSFLFFLWDLQWSQVLFDLSFIDPMLIFEIFERYLPSFLQLSLLINILEEQMLQALLPNLDRDLILLFEILELSLLIPVLCLFVF